MPDPKFPPALRKPTSEYPTPSPAVGFFTEIVDRTDSAYTENAPVARGTLYSTIKGAKKSVIDAYPLLYFVRESKLGNSDQLVIWIWSTVFNAESSYNAEITYLGDAVANPSFARVYKIRRDVYDAATPPARGSTLTALTGVRITAAGTGYTYATGTVATGATVEFVVNPAGQIISGVVTNEGSGVISGASIAITGDGTGATATAIVQPVGAILTSEKKQEFPEDDVLRNEFVKVIRVYEVLPGPYLPFTRYDENLGPIQGQRRAVVNTGQVTVLGATSKTTYEARDGSSYVSWEIQESWSDGTGSPGNPAYPIGKTDFNDPERGPIHQVSQITTDATSAGSSTVSGGTVTTIRYEPYQDNPNLRKKIVETWAVPRTRVSKKTNAKKQVVTSTETREDAATTPATPTATKDVDFKVVGDGTAIETADEVPGVFDQKVYAKENRDAVPERFKGGTPDVTERHVVAGAASAPSLSSGDIARSEQQQDVFTKQTSITNRSDSYPSLEGQEYDEVLDAVVQYVESVDGAGSNIGSPRIQVTPLGKDIYGNEVELARTINTDALDDLLGSYLLTFPGTTSLNLPDELLAITSTMEKSSGNGSYQTDTAYGNWSGSGGWSVSARGTGQGSASIMPSIQVAIKEHRADHVPSTHYLFYLKPPITTGDILTFVGAVSTWPKFKPQSATIVSVGRRVSLQVNVESQAHDSGSSGGASQSYGSGHGVSREIGMTIVETHISPTIHGAISVGGTTSDTETVTASAASSAGTVSPYDAADESQSETETILASTTVSLSATSGDTTVPTSGKYILDCHCEPYKYGWVRVHAEVVDFADV